ncbi:MAG: DNA-processing protein DprA [Candidatus Edwardsbacteria bacterium]|nr:DNA-processing protein DprA [Candidatus Edwardsbacteria bacterium]MBU1576107.1 DNA-processing protein DprA [Candidatus Edwardsbacteria bacterium]MBU2463149.1 DNA-processing protein DprA [Candidatus Edwardsbacteria bacterium]MBU2593807.1 DNA-processing protein DprA [Candidatus Edwardsbacteria bacterium]
MKTHEELLWWLRLQSVKGVGSIKFNELIRVLGDPQKVFDSDDSVLAEIPKIDARIIQEIRSFKPVPGYAEEQLEKADKLRTDILTIDDPEYPENLKNFIDAPPILFVRGSLKSSDQRAVAIVGSRNATTYGKNTSSGMARELALAGITVVSGMARGIDSAAHQGALSAGGRTIAVLGCGVDIVYPAENKKLRDSIMENGALISEYPIGERPLPAYFPNRNRIITGISLGVLAVEAREDSGVFSTVRWAAEQGREVFAVPGPITSATSVGPNQLIKQGAKIVLNVSDILEELKLSGPDKMPPKETLPKIELDGDEGSVFAGLADDPRHIDTIAETIKRSPADTLRILFTLEMKGLIKQMPGKMFVRV